MVVLPLFQITSFLYLNSIFRPTLRISSLSNSNHGSTPCIVSDTWAHGSPSRDSSNYSLKAQCSAALRCIISTGYVVTGSSQNNLISCSKCPWLRNSLLELEKHFRKWPLEKLFSYDIILYLLLVSTLPLFKKYPPDILKISEKDVESE